MLHGKSRNAKNFERLKTVTNGMKKFNELSLRAVLIMHYNSYDLYDAINASKRLNN